MSTARKSLGLAFTRGASRSKPATSVSAALACSSPLLDRGTRASSNIHPGTSFTHDAPARSSVRRSSTSTRAPVLATIPASAAPAEPAPQTIRS